MDRHEQRLTIVRLEREFLRDPDSYRRKVALFAGLGYAYLYGIPILLLVVAAALLSALFHGGGFSPVLRLGVPLAALVYTVVAALRVRIPPPAGVELTRQDCRRFLDMMEALRKATGAPRPDTVLLTGELAASMVPVPRLGVFGWYRSYLAIGLPLLLSMPVDEFNAVLAHEFAHLSAAHGRSTVRIYRLRTSWLRLLGALNQRQTVGTWLFRAFARWYVPRLDTLSYVLARRHEFEADRVAARFAGASPVARSLVRLSATAAWLDKQFWPGVRKAARTEEQPPEHVFVGLARSLAAMPQSAEELRPLLSAAEEVARTFADPHPALADRLRAIKQPLVPPPRLEKFAGQDLLGQSIAALETSVSAMWREGNAEAWGQDRLDALEQRKRLEQLDVKHLAGSLSRDDAWERAELLQVESRVADYERAVQSVAAAHPQFAPALYAHGLTLLRRGEEQGLAVIDRAMSLSEAGMREACQAAYSFCSARGRPQQAQEYTRKAEEYLVQMERARAERQNFSVMDPLEAHGMAGRALSQLRVQFIDYPEVTEAYLTRKKVRYLRDLPVFVLGVHVRTDWWRLRQSQSLGIQNKLIRSLQLPGEWFCVMLDMQSPHFQERFKAVAGKAVYTKE